MAIFTGFKPEGMRKIASKMGYTGSMDDFDYYLDQNPEKKRQMIVYENVAKEMARGGVVKMQVGGAVPGVDDDTFAKSLQNQSQVQNPGIDAVGNQQFKEYNPLTQSYVPPANPNYNNEQLMKNIQKQRDELKAMQKQADKQFKQYQAAQKKTENQFKGLPKEPLKPIPRGGTRYFTDHLGMPMMEPNPLSEKYRVAGYDTTPVKPPVLEDVTKQFDLSKIDSEGFAPYLDDPRNFGKVDYYKEKAQKEYDERLKEFQENQKRFGKNFTPKQVRDYHEQQGAIARNEIQKKINPNLDLNFYNSPEYKKYEEEQRFMPGTMDMVVSPYFGQRGSGSRSRAEDNAYIAYLKRTGQENLISQGIIPNFDEFKANAPEFDVFEQMQIDTARMAPEVPTPTADARQLQQADVPVGTQYAEDTKIGDVFTDRAQTPALPEGGTTIPVGTQVTQDQLISGDIGQVQGKVAVPTTIAPTTTAQIQQERDASLANAQQSAAAVDSALSATQAAQTSLEDPRAKILAAQQIASSVSNLSAAQGQAILIQNPIQRSIEQGELISGSANAQTAARFTEQIQAATANPSSQATVAGQLANLTADFDATNPPAWAAGAIRGVQAVMAQRGIGASSIAGQALVQAAIESALPVAQADASVFAQFENQNLSNRQQRAMLAAQQRAQFIGQEFDQDFQARVQNAAKISDIANQNFTAEQQIVLENSRLANTMNLQNLSNRNGLVIAEASALANMDLSNLNNRQQAAVQNAQNFLQQDMANLTNLQQTELFKAQQRTQALFTDQAAINAANQFNAKSLNQVAQFYANLAQTTSQFNATQSNAQGQFNAGQVNTVERFNAEINNLRDQYNASNQLQIAQNNAVWRREIATNDTVAINRANELNANAVLDISKEAYDNLWSHYSDTMEWAWTSADNQLDRINALAIAEVSKDVKMETAKMQSSSAAGTAVGNLIGTLGGAAITKGLFG